MFTNTAKSCYIIHCLKHIIWHVKLWIYGNENKNWILKFLIIQLIGEISKIVQNWLKNATLLKHVFLQYELLKLIFIFSFDKLS